MDALHQLATAASGPSADAVKERAAGALLAKSTYDINSWAQRVTPQSLAANITVVSPSGSSLPESFLAQDWKAFQRRWLLPSCLNVATAKCEALLVDLDGDGQPEILLFNLPGVGAAFKAEADNTWKFLGTIANTNCRGVRAALLAGQFEVVQSMLKDIEVAGQRLRVTMDCPAAQQH